MTISPDRQREDDALGWVCRIADPEFSDWDAHIRWLECDPGNAELFDRLFLEIEAVCDGLEIAGLSSGAMITANDNYARSPARRRWPYGLAAAVAAIVCVLALHLPGPADRVVETQGGARQHLRLSDGTQIALNGATRLRIINDRMIALDRGEAFFSVLRDDRHPFNVQVGDTLVRDVGTAFDVRIAGSGTVIAVEEGMVSIDPLKSDIRLAAGQEARIGKDGMVVRQTLGQPGAIGGWRSGRLIYQSAPWTDVVTDLSRSLGVAVSVDPAAAEQPFTGVVSVDKNAELTLRRLAAAADMAITRSDHGWRLSPR